MDIDRHCLSATVRTYNIKHRLEKNQQQHRKIISKLKTKRQQQDQHENELGKMQSNESQIIYVV